MAARRPEAGVLEFIDGTTLLKLKLGALAHRHGDFERLHFQTQEE